MTRTILEFASALLTERPELSAATDTDVCMAVLMDFHGRSVTVHCVRGR